MSAKRYLIVFVVLSLLLLLVPAYGVANAKSPKPQDQVKNFIKAATSLQASKAAGYCVPEERSNATSRLANVPSGTKISVSGLKVVVTNQTADTAEAIATCTIKVQLKGQKKALQSNFKDTFNLKMVNGTWLIADTTMWQRFAGFGTPSTPTATPSVTPTATATATATPSPTTSGNPVRIGAFSVWSGPAAMAGIYYTDPVIKVVEKQVKDRGGILGGRPLEVKRYDTQATSAGAITAATRAIIEDKMSVVVFGGISGTETTSIAEVACKNNAFYATIAPIFDTPERPCMVESTLTVKTVDNTVVNLLTEQIQPEPQTVAILVNETQDVNVMVGEWKNGYEKAGIKTIYEQHLTPDIQDLSPYITQIKHLNPDVLLCYLPTASYVTLARQAMELGGWGDIQVVGDPVALTAASKTGAVGWLTMTPWYPGMDNPESMNFVQDFKTVTGKSPELVQIYYYLSMWTAIHAIELAGTAEDGKAIAAAARSGKLEFDTPMGVVHYSTDGRPDIKLQIMRIEQGGKLVPFK